jgi:type VI secretion system ImpM family protein
MSTAYFPAGCFGKLPTFGDFVRHNAASREARALDQWIQEGIYSAKTRLNQAWDSAFKNAPAHHFLFYPESADRFLVGILQPSWDKSERKYPFLVFIQVDRPRFGNHTALVPVVFASFFDQARDFIRSASNGLDLREITQRTERLNVPLPLNWEILARQQQSRLAATTMEELCTRVFGSFENPRKYLLFKNLTEILLPLRHRNPAKLSLGLRFPLSPEPQQSAYEASFWLNVSLRLLDNPPVTPIFFWTVAQENRPSYLFLFLRQPSTRNFVQLVQADLNSDIICELEQEGRDKIAEAANALPAAYRALLETPGIKLQEVLMRLA